MPGRVNLIGEHIDYHGLPVLPMAIPPHIALEFQPAENSLLDVESDTYGRRTLRLQDTLEPSLPGDWANYLKAAVQAVKSRWPLPRGFQGRISSNLPPAAGLSSSSALLTAVTLGLLRTNNIHAGLKDLMDVLPEGEHFVGTRGGGMDHAAVLASRAGCASLLHFAPFDIQHIHVPEDWRFLVAHSLTQAEKSGPAKDRYNACRTAGISALAKLGFSDYREALNCHCDLASLTFEERQAFLHVTSESQRVTRAVRALETADRPTFGHLLNASHASLRDFLNVSNAALDRLCELSVKAGADGARLTGAGFGGCVIILCTAASQPIITAALEADFYHSTSEKHLFPVAPSDGALYANN